MAKSAAVVQQEAELRKQVFFDPTYDPVFKKIFEKSSTLIHFLNAILHFDKEHAISRIVPLKRSVKLMNSGKNSESIRFDIHARTADGRFIDVEMQRAVQSDFLDRIDLYSSLLAINAKMTMNSEISKENLETRPYLMPTVYSVWICNFPVRACKHYREELGLFRFSDLGDEKALPIYEKRKYIIVDITKFTPGKGNALEQQWLELFKLISSAKAVPANVDDVLKDVYNRLLVSKSSKKFIEKVAREMVDKREFNACMSYARNEGLTQGLMEGESIGAANERAKNEALNNRRVDFLRKNNVSEELISAMLAIK